MDVTYRVFGDSDMPLVLPDVNDNVYGAIDQVGYRRCRSQRATIPTDFKPSRQQVLEIESAKKELLSLMTDIVNPFMIVRNDVNSFWTYIYTPSLVSQHHFSEIDGQFKAHPDQSYTLGRAEPRNGTDSFHVEFDERGTISLYEEWKNGTLCDLTLEPRKIKVSYVCDPSYENKDMITSIAELQSCEYETRISVPELCRFPSFRKRSLDLSRLECEEYLPTMSHQGRLSVIDMNKLDAIPLGEGVILGTIANYPFHVLLTTAMRGSLDNTTEINRQLLKSVLLRIAKRTLTNINRFPCPDWSDQSANSFVFTSDLYGINGIRIATVYLEVLEDEVSISTTDSSFRSNYIVYNDRNPFPSEILRNSRS
ncbi:unnamed protein product [Kuraishia capsulata CBS 1993]|uniref:Endoplasmic reticulum lectin n=1 Tax=Kuraishia capsulata CBS 1993 TaxID=1382522 RepID=W6MG49_9ASCO|nr:uncharacterized protein KUCA_T00000385001 [Kuraishia capsulata CBS 1993]CDK24423.1 unnamed protein product [Kuraishia capsulata CBS 1993]